RLPIVSGTELIRGAVPTPPSATSGTGPKPLLGNRSVAVRAPGAVGAKRTRTVQLAPGRTFPHARSGVAVKSPGSSPSRTGVARLSRADPVFRTVTSWNG